MMSNLMGEMEVGLENCEAIIVGVRIGA